MTEEKNNRIEREAPTSLHSHAARAIAITAGSLVLFLGVTALCGWLFNIPLWRSPLPGSAEVKFNTAICLCFAALSLLLRHPMEARRWECGLARALALVPLVFGALTLVEYGGVDLRIDEIFFRDSDRETAGRMAPQTAFSFFFAALALLCIDDHSSRRNRLSQIFAAVTTLFPVLVFIVGLYGTVLNLPVSIYSQITRMPSATALAFCFLAGGMALARPDSGFLRFLFTPLPSSALDEKVFRRLVRRVAFWPVTALVVLVLLLLGLVDYLLSSANAVDRSNRILTQLSIVEKLSVELETGLRGYQLTGDGAFLESFERARQDLPREMVVLEKWVRNVQQASRVTRLRPALDEWTGFATNARDRVSTKLPVDVGTNLEGKAAMDGLRGQIHALQTREHELLAEHVRTLNRFENLSVATVLLLGLGLAPLLALSLRRTLKRVHAGYREALAAREQSEDKTRSTLASITDGFYVIDAEGRFTELNAAAMRMFAEQGVRTGALLGRHVFTEVFPEAVDTEVGRALRRAMVEHVPTETESFYPPWQRWLAARFYPTADGGVTTLFRDITSRKQAEVAVRESERRFRELADNAPVMVWVTEPDGHCSFLSESWYRYTGQTPAEGLGFGWVDATHPDDRQRAHDAFTSATARKGPFRIEYRLRGKGGEYRWALNAAMPRLGENGEFLGFVGSILDIHDQKMGQEALRMSEGRFRAAVGAVSSLIWTNNEQGQMDGEQPGWSGFTGQSQAEYRGYGWAKAVHPDDAQPTVDAWNEAVAAKRMFEFEHRVRRRDGEWRLCSVRAVPVLGDDGAVREWVGVHTDITERKRTEEALRESEERFRAIADNVPHLAWMADGGSNVVWFNKAWLDYTGTKHEDNLRAGWKAVHHPNHVERVVEKFERHLREGLDWEDTFPLRGKDGQYRWFLSRMNAIRDESGKVLRFFGTNTDVTPQREIEAKLAEANEVISNRAQQLEKLVEKRTVDLRDTVQQLETFSYSIVHDMRAPLRSMRSFAGFLAQDYREKLDDTGRDYLQRIINSAGRMDALITDVLTYSRISSAETPLARVDLDKLVTDIVQNYPQFQELAGAIHIERPLPVVRGNAALLTQIISNLLGNAVKFVPPDRAPCVTVRGGNGNGKVRLWVEDNGIGIAPQFHEKIFGLFQRLHRPDQYSGTGVGLAIVKRAAERMGGAAGFESEPGKGSRFWVELDALGGEHAME